MNEHEAQRFLNEQRYQAELPFPVSAVFTHYARSSSKNYALRSLQLVATAQSTIRYTAIVAACDYAANPDADEGILNWLRQEWLGGKKPSFGTWYGALMRLLAESGKSWKHPFVPEFGAIDRELLEKKIQPLIHSRNVEIGHAEYYEALALKHFVELQEENLFAVMEQFSFLARYPLAFAEVEDDYEPPSPGTKQAVNICRGASHNFARYTVAPSHPLPPGAPFIWNPEYTGILTLSPFLIYGRATTDAEQKERVKGVAHIQGLMVMNGVTKGSPVYTSVDAEAQFSLDSFEFPPKERIQEQVDSALKKGLDVPSRMETRLSEDEKELFVRTTDYVEPGFEKESVPLQKKKPSLKTVLVSAILGVLVLIVGFALYSRFTAPKQQIRSIAVLAFRNISDDPKQEYLCEGIAETIINTLTRVDGLNVTARTSAFSFKGKNVTIAEIGKELNVETVLEGSIQKEGDNIRITAQLIKVDDEYHLWSDTYNRKMESIFAIQDEISQAIVRALKGRLLKEEKTAIKKRYTENTEAFELYLQGLSYWNKRNEEGMKIGIQHFQQAISIDPFYALAYAGIADCYNMLGYYSYLSPKEAYPRAKIAAEKALKIDDTLAEAHASLGWVRLFFDWDWPEAQKEFKQAIDLNPNYAEAHSWFSVYLRITGQFDDAIAEIDRAQELDPLSVNIITTAGNVRTIVGRYNEAMDYYNKALEMDPSFPLTYFHLGQNNIYTMRWEEAIASLNEFMILSGSTPLSIGFLGYAYAMSGRKDEALKMLKRLNDLSMERYVSPFFKALIFMGLGEKDQVFKYLEQAYEDRETWLVTNQFKLIFQSLRDDPRFTALIKKNRIPGIRAVP